MRFYYPTILRLPRCRAYCSFLAPDPDPVVSRRQRQLWAPLREWAGTVRAGQQCIMTIAYQSSGAPPLFVII